MPVLLILASKNPKDIDFCQKVSSRSGFDLLHSVSTDRIMNALVEQPQSLIFWDIDSPEFMRPAEQLSLNRMVPILTRYLKPRQIFGLADSPVFELPDATRTSAIGHYVVRNYDAFGETWISRVGGQVFSPQPFGLDYLKDEKAKIMTIELKASNERPIALEAIGNVLVKKGMHERAKGMILTSLDELLMNAIFDAPVDKHDRRYRRETTRTDVFPLEGVERVSISVAFNEIFTVVSVRDQFGSFVSKNALDAAKKDYSQRDYINNSATKSASLGLHGIASSGVGLLISSKPNVATEAVLAFPFYKNFKETKTGFRSFSFNA